MAIVPIFICMGHAAEFQNVHNSSTDVQRVMGSMETFNANQGQHKVCLGTQPMGQMEHQVNLQRLWSLRNENKTLVTLLKPKKLAIILGDHTDATFSVEGFSHGLKIPHAEFSLAWSSHNQTSARLNEDFLFSYLCTEIEQGWVMGPFSEPPHPLFISSPLRVVPKNEPAGLE